ncbi:MAG: hypothetical protein K2X77_06940 [Candidatus Obscuribacterales bacterium]|nr:hypothetical protein [Candidatus Obscuribacterales bacterium]
MGVALTMNSGPLKVLHDSQAYVRVWLAGMVWGVAMAWLLGESPDNGIGYSGIAICTGLFGWLKNCSEEDNNKACKKEGQNP